MNYWKWLTIYLPFVVILIILSVSTGVLNPELGQEAANKYQNLNDFLANALCEILIFGMLATFLLFKYLTNDRFTKLKDEWEYPDFE